MGKIKRILWRKYDDYRIQQYCIKECPYCHFSRNGQASCYGKFEKDGKSVNGAGIECDKIINFCFDENIRQINYKGQTNGKNNNK